MIIGYARVSTEEQSLNRQLDALKKFGAEKIFTEKMTGVKSNRPELERLKEICRSGDTVVIESLSRLGRSTKDLLALIEDFEKKSIILISLKENIDISTPTGLLMTTVLSALSQFERDLIVQRTNEGLASARARGRIGGRKKIDDEKVQLALKMYKDTKFSIGEIIQATGISRSTLYKYVNEEKNTKSNKRG